MALDNQSSTSLDHIHLPDHPAIGGAGPEPDDRVLAVHHRSTTVAPHRNRADNREVLHALVTHLMPANDDESVQPEIVVRYIDYLIANEVAGPEVPLSLAEVYSQGCDCVQAHACEVYGQRVQKMTAAERDQLIWDMLECSMDGFERFSPAYLFHTLRRHIADAMQGGVITSN